MSGRDISAELKGLQSQAQRIREELEPINAEYSRLRTEIDRRSGKLRELNEKIRQLQETTQDLIVSEHALLRYLERVNGIDMEAVRAAIVTPKLKSMADTLGSGTFPGDGFRVKIKGRTIVTVITRDKEES